MSFGTSGSYQKSSSSQGQGLTEGSRGYFSGLAGDEIDRVRKYSKEAALDPGGLAFQPVVDQLLPVGRYGQSLGADQGIMQLGRDSFTHAAGNRIARGFKTPANLDAVIGDSMRMASSALVPAANQFAMSRANMNPQLRQASFGYRMTPMDTIKDLLSSSGSGKSNSIGIGASVQGSALPTPPSDRRLKTNIIKIGQHPLGIGWYEYTILGKYAQGVMADELLKVKPEAVITRPDGYMTVDYNMIGRME